MTPCTPQQAFARLQQGNARFVADRLARSSRSHARQRRMLVTSQRPFAVVLGCSDSRVPMELVFDQGLGDLFVVRVAGNIATPTQIASVEFPVLQFETPLVVVLGHQGCGAVQATLQAMRNPDQPAASPHLQVLIGAIQPCAQAICAQADAPADDALVDAVVHANVHATLARLREESTILQRALAADALQLMGAVYNMQTGAVDFLQPAPRQGAQAAR